MKYFLSMCALFFLCCPFTYAGKIEKKVTIGRAADCKGIAFNCTSTTSRTITAVYMFNENSFKGIALQISQQEVSECPDLVIAFNNRKEIQIEEDMVLEPDIATALGIAIGYRILKGTYQIVHRSGVYTILFHTQ